MKIIKSIQSFAQKALGMSEVARLWLTGEDMPDSKSSKPTKPYAQVGLVFTCVNKLISGISGLPCVLSTIDDRVVEGGPQYDVLFNNPAMSFERLVTETIGHYVLGGDVFWLFTDMQGFSPKEIMVVSGSQMHPITHDRRASGVLLGWEFRGTHGQHVQFGIDEVHQWKIFNPYDRFHGMGPVKAASLSINYSYAAGLFNTSALDNGAELGLILTTQGRLEPDQVALLRSQFDSRHKGASQAKKTAVLTGGMDVKTASMKMTDMQMAKIKNMTDKEICSAFGVPPGVVGLITEAQYSHGPSQEDFIFNTIIPLARLLAAQLTTGILSKGYPSKATSVELKDGRFNKGLRSLSKNVFYRDAHRKAVANKQKLFAWFDTSQHPTVQKSDREVAEKVLKFTEAGVTLNDIIEAHNLPYKTVPWGGDWWIQMGRVPAKFTLEAGIEGITGPPLPEGEGEEEGDEDKSSITEQVRSIQNMIAELKGKDSAEAQRLRIWRNWVISWAGIEREYKDALRVYFVRQERILIDKLKKALADLGEKSITKDNAEQIIARVVFDLRKENDKIKVINHTFFEKASELGIRQGLTESSALTGDALDAAVQSAKSYHFVKAKRISSAFKLADVNQVTRKKIASQLQSGLDKGEGLNKLTARVKETLGSNRARALRIARTQTAGAVGTGRHAGMKAAAVEKRFWLTSRDTEVRDAHVKAEQKYSEGIALDMPFIVDGEQLMYPGDPSGSAKNIINCRCVALAKAAQGKSFGLAYYANTKFYSYQDMQNSRSESKE